MAALVTKSSAPDDPEARILGADEAAGPPAYLSVDQFKQCLGHKKSGGASVWCKLQDRPENCPLSSWKELHEDQPATSDSPKQGKKFTGSNCEE